MAPPSVVHAVELTSRSHASVFLAGSFSDPPWMPLQMEPEHSDSGGTTFRANIQVKPGQTYEYKFKTGHDEWFLDQTAPTVKDKEGNENNLLLLVPDTPSKSGAERKSSVTSQPAVPLLDLDLDEELEDDEPLETPLLAHESFGTFDDAKFNKGLVEEYVSRQAGHSKPASHSIEDVDLNDPTLERFPTDKHSVMETLRKIQSRQSEDSVEVLGVPPSRRAGSEATMESPGTLPPASFNASVSGQREHRSSHGAPLFKTVSAASMGSIAEEEGDEPSAQ